MRQHRSRRKGRPALPCQGDALGVELATSAPAWVLVDGDLLAVGSRLFPLSRSEQLVDGLVIDDCYAITCPRLSCAGQTAGAKALATAQKIYDRAGLVGSREEDVVDADKGCCVDGSARTRGLGLALVGPPVSKRIGLAALSLEACRLTHTSDHLHLSLLGAWASALMFRRPFMSVLQRAYGLVDSTSLLPQ